MSHKDKKNKTSFIDGNKAAEKWTLENAIELFETIRMNAYENDEILCLQDAYIKTGIWGSSFFYLIDKFPVLENFKNDIQDAIIIRINKGALKGSFVSTPSIWRMKQLGEADTTETVNKNINLNTDIKLSKDQLDKFNETLETDY